MARAVVLSNGQLLVGLNEHGLVHDFYYPYVGLDNLATARHLYHKIGVWVDGQFSWVDSGDWEMSINFEDKALISQISFASKKLSVELIFTDFVDSEYNSFIRRVKIFNKSTSNKEVRIFFHQVFEISRAGRGDTALYVPDSHSILDYKGRYALLISGRTQERSSFDQYAVGLHGIEAREGTYKDAEDGELSNNPVEHGGVDSVIRFTLSISPNQSQGVDYWVIASDSQQNCEDIQTKYIAEGVDFRERAVREYWDNWISICEGSLSQIDEKYHNQITKSLLIIKAHCDRRGGILASGDSSVYNYGRDYYCYCWPRDGAYAIWPMIRMGYTVEPKKFFEFCRDTLGSKGCLMHKYQPDRAIGSTWHPLIHNHHRELAIQEDETAIVLYLLGEYYKYTQDDEFVQSLYNTLIQPAANFIQEFIDIKTGLCHASYDLWEEKFLSSTYTSFVVQAALRVCADFAEKFDFPSDAVSWRTSADKLLESSKQLFNPDIQSYRKGLLLNDDESIQYDDTADISNLYGPVRFGSQDPNSVTLINTLKYIEAKLRNNQETGGYIRYDGDQYMTSKGSETSNPWHICSLWLAQYYVMLDRIDEAISLLDWSKNLALPSGILSEQIHPVSGHALSVAPLVWSHAEFISTALDIYSKNK